MTLVNGAGSLTNRIMGDGRCQSAVLVLLALGFLHGAPITGTIFLGIDIAGMARPWTTMLPIQLVHNGLLSDTLQTNYPWRSFVDESLRSGVWPLWNPYILAGHPTFASIDEQIFYPPNVLLAFLPADLSFSWLAWLHLSVAGIGTRAFTRLHVTDDASACLAAIVVMFSGPTIVWLEYPAFLSTLCWAGVGLFFIERTFRDRRLPTAVAAGLAFGLGLLGGQVQLFLYLTILVVVYVSVRLMSTLLTNRRAGVRAIGLMIVAAGVAGGIGSLAIVPALEFLGLAQRTVQDLPHFLATTLPGQNLVTFVLPKTFGTPVEREFVGVGNFNEATVYLGLLPVVLAGLFPWTRSRSAALMSTAVVGIIFVAGMFGIRPVDEVLAQIPFIRYFELNRLATVLPLCFGLVAATTFAALPSTGRRRFELSAALVIAALVVGGAAILGGIDQLNRPHLQAFAKPDVLVVLALLIASAAAVLARIWARPNSPWCWLGPLVLVVDLVYFGFDYNTLVKSNPLAGTATPPLDAVPSGPFAPRTVGLPTDSYVLNANLGTLWNIPVFDNPGWALAHSR